MRNTLMKTVVVCVPLLLCTLSECSSANREEVIQLGHGREVAKSKVEEYAKEKGVSYERALELLETAVALDAGAQKIKKNPGKYGVRP